MDSRRPGLAANLLLLLGTTLVVLGALEGGLRAFWDGYYVKNTRVYQRQHPTRGRENVPSVDVVYGTPEFSTRVIHDAEGLRVSELGPPDGERSYRVVAVGDSFTYGIGVEGSETYSARLEQLDPSLRVFNLGVAGYATSHALVTLREVGFPRKPDLVILAYLWNDLGGNFGGEIPRFTLEDGVLVQHPPRPEHRPLDMHPKSVRHPWLGRLYTYRFVSDRIKLLQNRIEVWRRRDEPRVSMSGKDVEAAWALQAALLDAVVRECREHGAEFLLVIIPDQVQVYPEWPVIGFGGQDYRVQERLLLIARERGLNALDLLPAFQEVARTGGEPLYYRYDRHWTPAGHALTARLMLDEVRAIRAKRAVAVR